MPPECRDASDHARTYGGKEWTFVVIPDREATVQRTLSVLEERWMCG